MLLRLHVRLIRMLIMALPKGEFRYDMSDALGRAILAELSRQYGKTDQR